MNHESAREHARSEAARVDETGRVIVRLPDDATLYGDAQYLAIAFDRTSAGASSATLLGGGSPPFLAGWSLISLLCYGRAGQTVDETLTVGGKTITPEAYLKLWRAALAKPLSLGDLAEAHDLVPVFLIDAPLAGLRGTRRAWTTSPWETFDEFENAYRDRMVTSDGEQRFRLEIDLRLPQGPRDAFYAASFVSDHRSRPAASHTQLVLRSASASEVRPAQAELFATV